MVISFRFRRLCREKEALPAIPDRDEAKYLSIRYSHPKWLVKRLLVLLGQEGAEAFLTNSNRQPPAAAQVNTLKTGGEALLESLRAAGAAAEPHPWLPDCLLLTGAGNLERLEPFRRGKLYIQDPASRLAVLAAVCAAVLARRGPAMLQAL